MFSFLTVPEGILKNRTGIKIEQKLCRSVMTAMSVLIDSAYLWFFRFLGLAQQ